MRRKQFQGYSTEKNCLSKIMEYGQARRNEKNSGGGGGGLSIMYYCQPPWLAKEENFSFQIV